MKKNKKLIIIVFILILVGLATGGYFYYKNKKKAGTSSFITRLDDNRGWVYNANYDLPTKKDSYYGSSDHSKLVNAKDIVLPYINIESNDAKKANEEIYQLYEKLINDFNEYLKDEIRFSTVKYSPFIYNNYLSIIITTETGGNNPSVYEYYTYNFDLTTGKNLSYNELYKILNYDEENMNEIVKNAIANVIQRESKEEKIDDYVEKSFSEYLENYANNTLKYYINTDNKLTIISSLYLPNESEKINKRVSLY